MTGLFLLAVVIDNIGGFTVCVSAVEDLFIDIQIKIKKLDIGFFKESNLIFMRFFVRNGLRDHIFSYPQIFRTVHAGSDIISYKLQIIRAQGNRSGTEF